MGEGKIIPVRNMNFDDTPDMINKPEHYHKGGLDVIGFAEMKLPKEELRGFYRINVMKYVTRADLKGGNEDYKKARFYLNKLIEMEDAAK